MYLEVRAVEGKKKYYLAHSYRESGKVKKIRAYLGSNLSKKDLAVKRVVVEKELRERVRLLKFIRDPFHTVLSLQELGELRVLADVKRAIQVKHLSEKDWLKFTEAFAFDTNAIEGSTVTAREAKSILERDEWPADRAKWEVAETYGVAEAIDYLRETKEHVSLQLMAKLHEIVFKNSKGFAGKFRRKGVEVAVVDSLGRVIHRGAPSTRVKSLLGELVKWYDGNKKKYPPLVLAAVVHNQFENVHPFQDGNGRVGRLLLNNVLLKHGLPPVNIELKHRREYYASLQEYEHRQNLRPTIELLLKEYRALEKTFKKR